MATRTLLCVEPDAKDADLIRQVLGRRGFEVKNITNGEQAIDWGRKHTPAIIVVCVEPRKVGYAICNKIKRSPELKDVPLILTSSEETQQTFEQHKKLKSRAEEYILKPLKGDELVAKVGRLVGVAETSAAFTLDGDSEEELSIADGDILEEKSPSTPMTVNGGPDNTGKIGGIFGKSPELDEIFDQETEAAFAAIQSPDTTGPMTTSSPDLSPVPTAAAPAPPVFEPDEWNAESTRASDVVTSAGVAPNLPPPLPHWARTEARALYGSDGADVPSPDDVMHPVASDISAPHSIAGAHDGRIASLQARINQLETEKDHLDTENDELKTRLQAQPLSKEKDILSLRETINRKEKDLLDLRDALDAKERQILDHKDRVRENERARRDLEEKMLGFEKTLVAANERVTALAHDKEKSIDRERGLKARLDDALTEIQKAHEEVDALKRRLQGSEERARAEVDRTRGELETRISELEDMHRLQVGKLNEESAAVEAAAKKAHEAELARVEAARAAEVEALGKRLGDELAVQTERAQTEATKLRRDHDKALASLKEEQAVQLAAERQAHQAAIEGKERDHRNEILGMRRRHEEELAAAEERRQKELTEAEGKRVAELEAAETRRRAELQARDEEHHAAVAEMDRRHFDEKTEMGERHRNETDQASARAARAEGELAARTEELAEVHRKIATRESDLDAVRADVRERDVKLAQTRDRITELEAKAAELEDQVLRAYQKLRTDEKTLDKAKRALAVALSLLDGGTTQPAQAQPAAAPSRSSEESGS